MRSTTVRALQALLVLAPATIAWTAANRPIDLEPSSTLWVSGTSTVRSWQCAASAFDAAIIGATESGTPAAVIAGEKAVTAVAVTVPVEKLDCKNGKMNEHMLNALKAKEFATISYKLSSYDLAKEADAVKVTLTGVLTLGGVQKTITMRADARQDGGALRVTGVHELNMKEYGLKPPTLMLGTMKVGEVVKVNFDLLLKD